MKMPLDLIAGLSDDDETDSRNEHCFVAKVRDELQKTHEIA